MYEKAPFHTATAFDFYCTCANELAPVYEITNYTTLQETLPEQYVQLLSDKEGKWAIGQVSTLPLTNQFAPTLANYPIKNVSQKLLLQSC